MYQAYHKNTYNNVNTKPFLNSVTPRQGHTYHRTASNGQFFVDKNISMHKPHGNYQYENIHATQNKTMTNYLSYKELNNKSVTSQQSIHTAEQQKIMKIAQEIKDLRQKYEKVLNVCDTHEITINENKNAIYEIISEKSKEKKIYIESIQLIEIQNKITKNQNFSRLLDRDLVQVTSRIDNFKEQLIEIKNQLNFLKSKKQQENSLDWSFQINRIFDSKINKLNNIHKNKETKNPQQEEDFYSKIAEDMQKLYQQVQEILRKNKTQVQNFIVTYLSQVQDDFSAKLEEKQKSASKYLIKSEALNTLSSVLKQIQHTQFKLIPLRKSESTSSTYEMQKPSVFQKTYLIDMDGYLLDQQNRYLLTQENKKIQFSKQHIQFLKKCNIISNMT